MKTAKKLTGILLALAMMLALSVSALADGTTTGTITVDNPVAGQTYTAYKIFDVKYNSDKTAYSYTISGTSEWFSVVASEEEGVVTSRIAGLTFEKANSANVYNVIKTDSFSAAAFAETLKANVTGKTGTALTLSDGKASVSGLALGYYFVASTSGALCNLTTTNPTVTIHDKNDIPFEKTDDAASADVGQTVNYVITGKVPDYTGFQSYSYVISDTMSEGLTFNKDVAVKIGGVDKTAECTVTYDVEGNANSFTVSVPVMSYEVGAAIVVSYSAVVNEKAIVSVQENDAKLEYSKDPTTAEKGTLEDETTVHIAEIVIDKYEQGNETKKLAGAQFVLYKLTDNGTDRLYYKWVAATVTEAEKVEWVSDIADATVVTTDENGAAGFGGLADGTYYLEETVAPEGYNLLSEAVEITIAGDDTDETTLSCTAKVANNTGVELPATGGIGTTIFYVLGGALVLGAVVLLVTRKRMSDNC